MSGSARIRSTATALPAGGEGRAEWENGWPAENVAATIATTGIERVRVAPAGRSLVDYAATASRRALALAGCPMEAVDAVLVVTQTPDDRLPPTACRLQEVLGLRRDIPCLDLHHGCTGYVYGLEHARLLVAGGAAGTVLLCTGDLLTRLLGEEDHTVRMVFGDGVAATVIVAGEEGEAEGRGGGGPWLSPARFGTEGSRADELCCGSGPGDRLRMDGLGVMSATLRRVPELVAELQAEAGAGGIDRYFFHQANAHMLDCLRRKLQLGEGSVPVFLRDTGNLGSASIPLAMARARAVQGPLGGRSALVGYGVGFSWAGLLCDLSGLEAAVVEVEVEEEGRGGPGAGTGAGAGSGGAGRRPRGERG